MHTISMNKSMKNMLVSITSSCDIFNKLNKAKGVATTDGVVWTEYVLMNCTRLLLSLFGENLNLTIELGKLLEYCEKETICNSYS